MFPMSFPVFTLFFSFSLLLSAIDAFNITEILSVFPDFTTFNNYLTQTGVASEINSKQTVTVLVVANENMTALSGQSTDVIKKVLSMHVILGYYDSAKLIDNLHSTLTLTTLYQESGKAQNQEGFLNVTREGRGSVSLGSAAPGSSLDSTLDRTISTQPYSISVLQISNVIEAAPSSLTTPSSPTFNITKILSPFSDFTTFNNYLTQTAVASEINSKQAVTVLVVANENMTALSGQPTDVMKKVLSMHVILGYYDSAKLSDNLHSALTLTTLYQESGKAQNQEGFLNVTRVGRGPVSFGSAATGSSLDSTLVRTISTQPYHISVLQISNIIEVASSNSTTITPSSPSAPGAVVSPTTPPHDTPAASPPRKVLAPPPNTPPQRDPPAASPPRKVLSPTAGAPAGVPASATRRNYNNVSTIFVMFITSACFLLSMIS